MSTVQIKPWGVQVAGNFRRAVAIRQWQRVKARFPALLAGHEPAVSRVRPASVARRRIYAVRIGAGRARRPTASAASCARPAGLLRGAEEQVRPEKKKGREKKERGKKKKGREERRRGEGKKGRERKRGRRKKKNKTPTPFSPSRLRSARRRSWR